MGDVKGAPFNPWALPPPRLKEASEILTDPAQPGVELAVTLRALKGTQLIAATERVREYVAEYVGTEEAPVAGFPAPDGSQVPMSEGLCQAAVMLEAMHVPEDGGEPWPFLVWVGLADRMPSAWLTLTGMMGSLFGDEMDRTKNSPGADAEDCSDPSLNTTNNTRRSRRDGMHSSARS